MKQLIYYIILLLITAGCIEEYTASISFGDENLLVVEGDITEGTCTFYLSKNFSLDESTLPEGYNDISATLVVVGDNGYRSQPATNPTQGVFEVETGTLEDHVAYGIEIVYNGETYLSEPSKPLHTPEFEKVEIQQPVEEGDVSIYISTQGTSGDAQYFMWDYKEDWEYTADYYLIYFWTPQGDYYDNTAPQYYCWRKASNKEILIGSTETLKENRINNQKLYTIEIRDERLSVLYSTLVTQRSISKAAYEFYQNKIKLNNEMGGLFTPQPSEVGGNIECTTNPTRKAIGYVETIKNIAEKRIFIDPKEDITRPRVYSDCDEIPDKQRREDGLSNELFYYMGHRLLSQPGDEATWTTLRCAHCTARGGTKNKPDFWPNNHI